MTLVTFTILTILLSVGYAFAGAGAPVPPGSQNAPSSGRPGAILDEAACQAVWTKAGGGDSLTYDQAGPYVTNLKQADPDDDGVFSKEGVRQSVQDGLGSAGAFQSTWHAGWTPDAPAVGVAGVGLISLMTCLAGAIPTTRAWGRKFTRQMPA